MGATAAAEQLVAEEADEAAKAAARKAKKQKAKARKQQARSDAIAASEPTTAPSLQSQQDVEQASPLPHSSPSASSGSTSDQDAASLQSQLQQNPAQSSAGHTLPVHVALDEPRLASTAVAGGSSAGSSAAIDAPRGADATFLDQLFCCPITKVTLPTTPPFPVL